MVKLHKLTPILWTKNLQETISFYEEVLGFKAQSNFPNFVSLTRDEVELMFVVPQPDPENCDVYPGAFPPQTRMTGSIFIYMQYVDNLWEQVKDKAQVKTQISNRAYYMRDFSILDNNGYELVFGQDIPQPG